MGATGIRGELASEMFKAAIQQISDITVTDPTQQRVRRLNSQKDITTIVMADRHMANSVMLGIETTVLGWATSKEVVAIPMPPSSSTTERVTT